MPELPLAALSLTSESFHDHVNGPIFTRFVADHGDLFIQANGRPFTFVEFRHRAQGFARGQSSSLPSHSLKKGQQL